MAEATVGTLLEGELEFHFEKSNFFRVIHVDGAYGGFSPANLQIHMAVFSERQPIPRKVVQEVRAGELGAEIPAKRVGKTGMFRELEADLVMSVETAIALRVWLDQKINEAQSLREQFAQGAAKP